MNLMWDVRGVAQHHIRLTEDKPFRERSRRLPPADLEDVRQHLEKLKGAEIIAESRSPYASPIVVVRKKNGQIRMCVDYRTLKSTYCPRPIYCPTHRRCIGLLEREQVVQCIGSQEWILSDPYE